MRDPRFSFVTRLTTRAGRHEGELQVVVSPEQFAALETDAQFLSSWYAHGLAYGIPSAAGADLERGRVVATIANGRLVYLSDGARVTRH